ncbi:hypothetical protein D9758_006656 [Tetrapyrgos nigripes]|uniref:Calcineurin-like phosphoesterase domain-containing protein n=1 Tax=Tetrapyrgos nigripes TaxID=182062 RepID=A0A8H5LQ87_9AGAR|nr:hypothetical protein D9758_006656 [Tetrapyrgos nigripes]
MWSFLSTLSLLALTTTTSACGGHDHSHHRRAFPSTQLTRPTRPLEWGDVNFLQTTDTHGWLLGHQKTSFPEPNYSGDLGDFASFVSHMKRIALEKDVDLLLIDSGDLHDGTGLSDGFPSGGIDGHDSNQFLKRLPYDVMAIGNHELYVYENTLDMYNNFAPALKGRYLSSNVNITTFDPHNNTINVPVGERFTKFTTRKGRKVTALGVLFDFTGNDVNTTVQKVEDMVKEEWFLSAIEEEPDFFLLAGHMPVQKDNWPLVFNAVRAVHPETPIMIFGGHLHTRDCVQLDQNSMSLASGRYMETVGWMSANLSSSCDKKSPSHSPVTFSRRYLDTNRVTYQFHSGTSNHTFDTPEGLGITKGLKNLAKRFNLAQVFGTAPEDYTISQVSYPNENSLLSLMGARVLPYSLTLARDPSAFNSSSSNSSVTIQGVNQSVNPFFMLTNSGSLRFDIYSGEFTKNDQLTASPFADAFNFVEGVEWGVALGVRDALDEAGEARRIKRRGLVSGIDEVLERREEELYKRGDVRKHYLEWLSSMSTLHQNRREMTENLTLGYATSDACPGIGDDTIHIPLESFSIPDFISSDDPTAIAGTPTSKEITNSTLVDLVFVDFIQDQLLGILNDVQNEVGTDKQKQWADGDVKTYSTLLSTEVLGVYAEGNWN